MTDHGIAIIGAGMIGAAHASGYRSHIPRLLGVCPGLQLQIVCDAREELAKGLAKTYGVPETAADWTTVMSDERIKIVSVCVPNFLHAEVVAAALAARKHVICEKPLALSAAEARRLYLQAEHAGVSAATVFNYRRFPAVTEVKRLIEGGEIGRPVHLAIQYQSDYAADPLLPHSWRYVKALAGPGALLDVGTHAIDVARYLCGDIEKVVGALKTTTISSRGVALAATAGHGHAPLSGEMRAVDNDDVTSALLLFQNGCQGTFSASRVAVGLGNTLSFMVSGTEGTVRFNSAVPGEYHIAKRDGVRPGSFSVVGNRPASPFISEYLPVPHDGVAVGYAEVFGFMIAEFLESIATGKPIKGGTLFDGVQAVNALEAIQLSAEEGRPIMLTEIERAAHTGSGAST
jgi:predicted dehydrogenase